MYWIYPRSTESESLCVGPNTMISKCPGDSDGQPELETTRLQEMMETWIQGTLRVMEQMGNMKVTKVNLQT